MAGIVKLVGRHASENRVGTGTIRFVRRGHGALRSEGESFGNVATESLEGVKVSCGHDLF